MKIVFDHQTFYYQKYGGISRYICQLAAGLARLDDFDVTVIAPFHINEYLRYIDSLFVRGPYFNAQFRGASQIRRWGRRFLLPIHYGLNRHADIVHETYYSKTPVGKGRFRIVTVHDMIHELFAEQFTKDLITSNAKIAAVSRADHVICISESTRQDLLRLTNIHPSKITVVYHGCTLSKDILMEGQEIRGHKKPYLLYVGNRGGYKNFLPFCHAFASSALLKKEFDIVAFGGGSFLDTEQALLSKLGISNQAYNIMGDDDLLAAYYRGATLFVYPSLYEGFGIPALEAMNFNCPVVCSNTSSIPEIVGDAGIYFDPYSLESMVNTMELAVNSQILRSKMISRGRMRCRMFSWEMCVSDTVKIYEKVARP